MPAFGSEEKNNHWRLLQNWIQTDYRLWLELLNFNLHIFPRFGLLFPERLSLAFKLFHIFLASLWIFVCVGAELPGVNNRGDGWNHFNGDLRSTPIHHSQSVVLAPWFGIDESAKPQWTLAAGRKHPRSQPCRKNRRNLEKLRRNARS